MLPQRIIIWQSLCLPTYLMDSLNVSLHRRTTTQWSGSAISLNRIICLMSHLTLKSIHPIFNKIGQDRTFPLPKQIILSLGSWLV